MDNKELKGFTLVEMLLVLTIVSAVLYLGLNYFQQRATQMRIDRTVVQMQQILNAGLSYYVANGQWPVSNGASVNITTTPSNNLQSNSFLPSNITISSPWGGGQYLMYTPSTGRAFTVYTRIAQPKAGATAMIIAGSLPMAYTSTSTGVPPFPAGTACATTSASCWISASVSIPGQNLNNARAVNFSGLVRPGGCVPVPDCPVDAAGNTMEPQVQIIPVSISGFNDAGSNATYPISSFTTYATGPGYNGANPENCYRAMPPYTSNAPYCFANYQGAQARGYWRACIQIVTEKGDVQADLSSDWASKIQLLAITRCRVVGEAGTSNTNIYGN